MGEGRREEWSYWEEAWPEGGGVMRENDKYM